MPETQAENGKKDRENLMRTEDLADMIFELDHAISLIETYRQASEKEPDIDILEMLIQSANKKIRYYSTKYGFEVPTHDDKYPESIPDFFERIGKESCIDK
jgi:hypothetical protein